MNVTTLRLTKWSLTNLMDRIYKDCKHCGKRVKNPWHYSWTKGICPMCLDNRSNPKIKVEHEITLKEFNPVDLYWHSVTSKFLLQTRFN